MLLPKSNLEKTERTMKRYQTTRLNASVILNCELEMEPFSIGGSVAPETMSSLIHAFGVESDLDESFNMQSQDGSISVYVGASNLLNANEYLKGFTDKELLADCDKHGIEHCREITADLMRVIQAAGVDSVIKINFKTTN